MRVIEMQNDGDRVRQTSNGRFFVRLHEFAAQRKRKQKTQIQWNGFVVSAERQTTVNRLIFTGRKATKSIISIVHNVNSMDGSMHKHKRQIIRFVPCAKIEIGK